MIYQAYKIKGLLKRLGLKDEDDLYELTLSVGYTTGDGMYHEYYLQNVEVSHEYGDGYIDANCFDEDGAVRDEYGNYKYTFKLDRFKFIKIVDTPDFIMEEDEDSDEPESMTEAIDNKLTLSEFIQKHNIVKAKFEISKNQNYENSDTKIVWLNIEPMVNNQDYLVLSEQAARVCMESNLVKVINLFVVKSSNGELGIVVRPRQ